VVAPQGHAEAAIDLRAMPGIGAEIAWRIVRASPDEQAPLESRGFGSRRIQ
jgi:hypothetical protein